MVEQAGLISVSDGRAIAETVKAVRGTPGREGRLDRFGSGFSQGASPVTITILNDTGEELPAYSVLRVDRTIDTNTQGGTSSSADDYKNLETYVWTATAPDENLTGQYAILQTRTPVNEHGEAMLVGVTKVRLDDTDEGDYADPQEDDTDKMKTVSSGKFPVLVVDTAASDDTWGYILLNTTTSNIIHAHVQSISDEWLTCKQCDPDGSYPEDDPTGAGVDTIKIYRSPDFRVSQWDGLTIPPITGILYTKITVVSRTAHDETHVEDDETQVITRDYETPSGVWLGSIIKAIRLEKKITIDGNDLFFEEINEGREWAAECA